MASKEAKQAKSTGFAKPLKNKSAKKLDYDIVEDFENYVSPRKAGKTYYGGGLVAHTPAVEPKSIGAASGTNPNLNNAQKMRSSRDVFLKDIAYGGLKTGEVIGQKDFAISWNEPGNLEYNTAAGQANAIRVDTRGVWIRDNKTRFKFTNMCGRSIFLQLHVPLAVVSSPKDAIWKIQNMVKTLKPGKSFEYTRRTTPASRVSPKKMKEFTVSGNKCLAADLLEFRVNIEDLGVANEEPLREDDAILRVESGTISDRGNSSGGINYQTLDFTPKGSTPFEYNDNEIVWLEELADGKFDNLTPLKLDTMDSGYFNTPKSGYSTVPVHPDDDYHTLRGIQFVNVQGQGGGTAVMAVSLTTTTSAPRPLHTGYENDPTAVFTDPALTAAVVIHVEGATWKSMYANNVVFKYHHNAGGWLMWDEANNGFFCLTGKMGAEKVTLPEYVSIETPIMMTTYATARAQDYQGHKGVKRDYDRLVKQLEESGVAPIEAEKKADEMFVALCEKNFPYDQDIRTKSIDWGEIFSTVLLGAVKIMFA